MRDLKEIVKANNPDGDEWRSGRVTNVEGDALLEKQEREIVATMPPQDDIHPDHGKPDEPCMGCGEKHPGAINYDEAMGILKRVAGVLSTVQGLVKLPDREFRLVVQAIGAEAERRGMLERKFVPRPPNSDANAPN